MDSTTPRSQSGSGHDFDGDTPRAFRALHGRQDGAVILMALGGFLILLLFSLMIYDAGLATKEKTEVQGATDFAALSQASVQARSMNMIAYGNIAKRSIWAVHSLYPAHFAGFRHYLYINLNEYCTYEGSSDNPSENAHVTWTDEAWSKASITDNEKINKCEDLLGLLEDLEREALPYKPEESVPQAEPGDFITHTGMDETDVFEPDDSNLSGYTSDADEPDDWIDYEDEGNTEYHYYDLKALDNQQRFVAGAAPWWGWTEQLLTGVRNGATFTASVPSPASPWLETNDPDEVDAEIVDRLPVTPPDSRGGMKSDITDRLPMGGLESIQNGGIDDVDPFVQEHIANNKIMEQRRGDETRAVGRMYDCESGGCSMTLAQHWDTNFTGLYWEDIANERFRNQVENTEEALYEYDDAHVVEPWELDTDNWQTRSSNIVFGYQDDHRDNRGVDSREKYDFVAGDERGGVDDTGLTNRQRQVLEAVGYWGMARGSVTFVDEEYEIDKPDLWHPAWTARLRPVALPGEELDGHRLYRQLNQNQQMIGSFHNRGIRITDFDGVTADSEYVNDFQRMRWTLQAIDDDTANGIVK